MGGWREGEGKMTPDNQKALEDFERAINRETPTHVSFKDAILPTTAREIRKALSTPAGGWQTIAEMPDGKSFLVAEKIMMQDGYFQPEIIYRNGAYYFREDRTKVNISTRAVFTEIPSPPQSLEGEGGV